MMPGLITRRRFVSLSGIATVAAVGACTYQMSRPVQAMPQALPSPGQVSARLGQGIVLHMFQTGWVAVKTEHRSFAGPESLRIPAILASRRWTNWMPVTAYVIEHPDGLIVVDTGETARILQPSYATCDPMTGLFYRRNLQFALDAQDELGPQMLRAGLPPDRVKIVVMTHLHSDHMGGMRYFPKARFLMSPQARGGHAGALMCRIPPGLDLQTVSDTGGPVGAFAQSFAVTQDGDVRIVPTPGHAHGHQSVLITINGRTLCIVGDAAFDLGQIISGEIGGIVENVADARASAARLKDQHVEFGTLMLPTHDPGNSARLRAWVA